LCSLGGTEEKNEGFGVGKQCYVFKGGKEKEMEKGKICPPLHFFISFSFY